MRLGNKSGQWGWSGRRNWGQSKLDIAFGQDVGLHIGKGSRFALKPPKPVRDCSARRSSSMSISTV